MMTTLVCNVSRNLKSANADAAVHEVLAEEWSEIGFKKLQLEGCCSSKWVILTCMHSYSALKIVESHLQLRCLINKWVAGEITARVFTDQWPDCTCVVVLYQEWLPQATSSKLACMCTCTYI